MRTVHAINGHQETTLEALNKAAKKAKGKALASITALQKALSPNRRPVAVPHPQKGEALKKHTHKKRAAKKAAPRKSTRKAHRTAKHNPTFSTSRRRRTTRVNPTGVMDTIKKLDLGGVVMDAALVTAGTLGAAFADRQVAKFLPSLNPYVRTVGTGLAIAGVGLYFGGKTLRPMAVGAIAELIRATLEQAAPGLVAGLYDEDQEAVGALAPGYFDEEGLWVPTMAGVDEYGEEIQGIVYRDGYPETSSRPDGF